MGNVFFILMGLIQLAIAVVGTRDVRRRFSWYALLVLIVVYGLAYDNLAIAAGSLLGEGDLTRLLNAPRYYIHALFTPAMMIAAFGALRLVGVGWAQGRLWHTVICVLATALILLGGYVDILNLALVLEAGDGVLRYVNNFHLFKGPPIPAVVTIGVVLVFGGVLWRKQRWPWLFLGALLMFMAAAQTRLLLVQNLGEITFAGSLVATMIHVHRLERAPAPAVAGARLA